MSTIPARLAVLGALLSFWFVSLLVCAAADAEFTSATLLSGSPQLQFSEANAPALASSGEYVAFQGKLAGAPGVYRRDLQSGAHSGEVTLVAGGDAAAPSISANGRYVAFTSTVEHVPVCGAAPVTRAGCEPAADHGCPEVYVRDMDPEPGEPEYELASTLGESEEGIAFDTTGNGQVGCGPDSSGFPLAGTQAAAGVALSADGREVVFTVLSESNLAEGSGGKPETPPGQVAVRDLTTGTTTLITEKANEPGRPVAGGGAYPDTYTFTTGQAQSGSVGLANSAPYGDQPAGSSAAISADGSTVAWLGMNVAEQVSTAEAEREPNLIGQSAASEAEPLWRRIAGEAGTNHGTRRLLAGGGLDFFSYNPSEPPNTVETGSFIGTTHFLFTPPALSENGDTVALVATAPPRAAQPSLVGRNTGLSEFNSDAYVVRLNEDLATPPQITPLTEIDSYAAQQIALGDIKDIAISPQGTRVAFDTSRTPLESPSLAVISTASAGFVSELYEANLKLGTLQRAISAYNGAEPNGGAELLSFDESGSTLAFASDATDLFFGDGVNAPEVYDTTEIPASEQVSSQQIGALPGLVLAPPEWLLSATATATADGGVLVCAQVPGTGRLAVDATAQLPSADAGKAPAQKKKARGRSSGRRSAGAAKAVKLTTRTVGQAAVAAHGGAEVKLRVAVSSPYSSLVASASGLYALLRVTFTAPGHKTLVQEIPVTFREVKKKRKAKAPAARRAKAPSARSGAEWVAR